LKFKLSFSCKLLYIAVQIHSNPKHMKTNKLTLACNSILVALIFFLFANVALSQVTQVADTVKTVKADTLKTTPVAAPVTTPAETPQADEKSKDKKEKKKNEIVFYTGVNFTQLGSSSTGYESQAGTGWHLGAYYKQGKFFYWQAGLRYSSASIGYKPTGGADFGSFTVSDIDIPVTAGINLLSATNRVLSLRLFISAVPAFTMKVGDNTYNISKDNVNSFILYGQGGVGVNVAFVVLELGYNYGFNELLTDYIDSKPGQVFINLGFRF
jgi:hypothetical protein